MDIKHVLSLNPLQPAYAGTREPGRRARPARLGRGRGRARRDRPPTATASASTTSCRAHQDCLEPFRLADRLVTNGEWLEFMADGGYRRPELWLSDGWATDQRRGLAGAVLLDRGRRRLVRAHPARHLAGQPGAPGRRTSATTRPTPTPPGPASGCPPRPSGSTASGPPGRPADEVDGNLADDETYHPRAAGPADRPAAPGVRRLLGVDLLGVPALPGLPPGRGRGRGVQRQVHVQPDGAARRVRAHPARPRPRQLPQLLPARRPVGAVRRAAGRRRRPARARHERPAASRSSRCCSTRTGPAAAWSTTYAGA